MLIGLLIGLAIVFVLLVLTLGVWLGARFALGWIFDIVMADMGKRR
jgi:hypothetical protein